MAYVKRTDTISGSYGSGHTPCRVFTAELNTGETWYAVEGSRNVNLTPESLENGVWVEELLDSDCFTWLDGVNSEDDLVVAVES